MSTPESILKTYFGYDAFRPLQKDIIESILKKQDTIALLPTGGGKSLCFQVPALMMEGLCIVVTPLIALMKDQVENLRNRDIMALALYSGMSRKEIEFELENCVNGKYKFLYVSPERLMSKHFLGYAQNMKLSFLAIDEAHCISQWGYDFRPPYLKIADFRALFNGISTMALTASATPKVLKDLEQKLELKQVKIFSKSFTRSNLSYLVEHEENKLARMADICKKVNGCGLVYVKSRRKTLEISRYLSSHKISADYYHAGLEPGIRTRKQDEWKKGVIRVMVCTNAFGMGIDKANVRFVIHEQKPDSLEAYYQEAGRAGRDEKPSYCILLHHESDFLEDRKNAESKYPSSKDIARVYEFICNYLQVAVGSGEGTSYNFDIHEMGNYYNIPVNLVYNALRILETEAYFQTTESVYLPSRMKILCSFSELYEWQIKHESVDALFKVILRSYGGMFDFYTGIYEPEIARRLKKPEKWIKEQLKKLHELGIVDYIPQNSKPQLIFLENRFNSIQVSDEKITFLRARYLEKVEEVNNYINDKNSCRSRMIVKYFGEMQAADCGNCDYCRAIKNKLPDHKKLEKYYAKFRAISANNTLNPEDIKSQISAYEMDDYLSILRWLKDNDYLAENKAGIWEWKKDKLSL